ncbi:MAG: hypothetical protein IT365_10910, partial [Candidatus Hydrogenedentes bacterium]|nr:hypothetical protein [Candidatus Hydrogenedentota bacterium]
MNRRHFLQLTGAAGALLAQNALPAAACAAELPSSGPTGAGSVLDEKGLISGRTLDDLIARYRYDLFDDFLPFMDAHVIDHELGGFMTTADRSGKTISTEKRTWFEGRGIWVYSHLYRTLAPEDRYLEVARKSVDFMLRAKPANDAPWPSSLTREGAPMEDQGVLIAGKRYPTGGQVYDDLFVAEGFLEYARATGK